MNAAEIILLVAGIIIVVYLCIIHNRKRSGGAILQIRSDKSCNKCQLIAFMPLLCSEPYRTIVMTNMDFVSKNHQRFPPASALPIIAPNLRLVLDTNCGRILSTTHNYLAYSVMPTAASNIAPQYPTKMPGVFNGRKFLQDIFFAKIGDPLPLCAERNIDIECRVAHIRRINNGVLTKTNYRFMVFKTLSGRTFVERAVSLLFSFFINGTLNTDDGSVIPDYRNIQIGIIRPIVHISAYQWDNRWVYYSGLRDRGIVIPSIDFIKDALRRATTVYMFTGNHAGKSRGKFTNFPSESIVPELQFEDDVKFTGILNGPTEALSISDIESKPLKTFPAGTEVGIIRPHPIAPDLFSIVKIKTEYFAVDNDSITPQ